MHFNLPSLAGGAQGGGPGMGADAARLGRLTTASEWVRALAAAGVPLLVGTGTPNVGMAPGARLHRELELLVAAGLTPVQALAAASTSRRSRALRSPGRMPWVVVADSPTSTPSRTV